MQSHFFASKLSKVSVHCVGGKFAALCGDAKRVVIGIVDLAKKGKKYQ